MKAEALKVGCRVWCPWKHCYLWFTGKAYFAEHYWFVDAADVSVRFGLSEVEKLQDVKE